MLKRTATCVLRSPLSLLRPFSIGELTDCWLVSNPSETLPAPIWLPESDTGRGGTRTAGHRMSCELRFCGRDGRALNRRLPRLKPSNDGDCWGCGTPDLEERPSRQRPLVSTARVLLGPRPKGGPSLVRHRRPMRLLYVSLAARVLSRCLGDRFARAPTWQVTRPRSSRDDNSTVVPGEPSSNCGTRAGVHHPPAR